MQNYFSLFDLTTTFDLDPADLEKRYFAAQRQFHPDRLAGKSTHDRERAVSQSMLANDAYQTLKDPLKRAQHLLALADAPEQKPPHELLMEIMELREALAEAELPTDVDSIAHKNEAAKQETLTALSQAFANADTPKAAILAMRLSYLTKLQDEIRIKKKSIPH